MKDTLLIEDFSAVPLRPLRIISNRPYRMLDADFPPAGPLERYVAVTAKLDLRTGEPGARPHMVWARQPAPLCVAMALYETFEPGTRRRRVETKQFWHRIELERTTMNDETIIERINNLVQEEHNIRSSPPAGGASEPSAAARLQSIESELDQCWDLLRQRRAKREFNDDPQEASPGSFSSPPR